MGIEMVIFFKARIGPAGSEGGDGYLRAKLPDLDSLETFQLILTSAVPKGQPVSNTNSYFHLSHPFPKRNRPKCFSSARETSRSQNGF